MLNGNEFIYIANIDIADKGYVTKIEGMLKAFRNIFNSTTLVIKNSLGADHSVITGADEVISSKRLLYLYINLVKVSVIKKPRLIYIRHPRLNPLYILTLLITRLLSNNTNIVHELPTYPYDSEFELPRDGFKKIADLISRPFLKYCVNLVVYIGIKNKDSIFGVPSLQIRNGIDPFSFPMQIKSKKEDPICLIGVGNLSERHGYDRVIEGMRNYFQDNLACRNIIFNIVGSGKEEIHLKELALKYKLYGSSVIFYPPMYGEDLDKLFNKADIGVGNLGFHRINVCHSSALKEMEYLTRGIPILVSFDEEYPRILEQYLFYTNADDSPVDIKNLIDDYTKRSRFLAVNDIRTCAIDLFGWQVVIDEIIIFFNIKITH